MLIRIERGKGGKERYVMLSAQLLQILRAYWRLARPEALAVPWPRATDEPVSVAALQDACRRARTAAGTGQAGDGPHPASQLRHPSA